MVLYHLTPSLAGIKLFAKGSIPIIISICFVGFDKAIIRCSPFWLLACQAPSKTTMHDASLRRKHRASQPKPSLVAPKNGASLLGTTNMPLLLCRKTCGSEVYRSTYAFHQNPNFCQSNNLLLDATLSQKVKWQSFSLTCFAAFPDCHHWFACQIREKPPVGFKKSNSFQFQ